MLIQKLRAREAITRSNGLMRGKFPSRKMNCSIHWESQLERDAVLLFEFSEGIISYREQPLTTHYELDSKIRRYTPDFEITLSTGEVQLIEVKPALKLLAPKERLRFDRIKDHFSQKGYLFRFLTDKEIRHPTLLVNLKTLVRYRSAPLSDFDKRRLINQLGGVRTISLLDAFRIFKNTSIWQLIDQKILFCDLRRPVNEQTIFNTEALEGGNEQLYF